MAAVEVEVEVEVEGKIEGKVKVEKDIRKLVLLENGKGQNGSIFEFFFMNYEFVYLSKMGNHWNKGENYPMHGMTSVELTHTVAKVFVANNLNHVGYVVLKDVTGDSTDPQLLYYFSEIRPAQHGRTSLKQAKDYAFYLRGKKYNLAADGTVTEAKQEKLSEAIEEEFSEAIKEERSEAKKEECSEAKKEERSEAKREKPSKEDSSKELKKKSGLERVSGFFGKPSLLRSKSIPVVNGQNSSNNGPCLIKG